MFSIVAVNDDPSSSSLKWTVGRALANETLNEGLRGTSGPLEVLLRLLEWPDIYPPFSIFSLNSFSSSKSDSNPLQLPSLPTSFTMLSEIPLSCTSNLDQSWKRSSAAAAHPSSANLLRHACEMSWPSKAYIRVEYQPDLASDVLRSWKKRSEDSKCLRSL